MPPQMPAQSFLDSTLAPKAAFDLQCPKDQLQYVDLGGGPLQTHYYYNDRTVVVVSGQTYVLAGNVSEQEGVSGCGRRASYTYENGAWVGSGGSSAAAAEGK
jgi:hypothetical protein